MPNTPQNPDPTQPVPTDGTAEQPPVRSDAGPPPTQVAATPAWADPAAAHALPPVGAGTPIASAATKASWRSKGPGGRGLAAGALVVGLGLGALGGSAATWAAVTHDDAPGVGRTADGRPGFDPDGDGHFGPPGGGRTGMPPGGQQQEGGTGRLPGGGADTGAGTDGSTGASTGSATDANGTSQAT